MLPEVYAPERGFELMQINISPKGLLMKV